MKFDQNVVKTDKIRKFDIIENEYKHNKGIEAYEIESCDIFIENLKKDN